LGLTGLHGLTIAVADLAQARGDFEAVLRHEVIDEGPRPAIAASAVALQVGDAVLELLGPDGDGPLRDHLLAHGEGIRSTVFGVRDRAQAARYLRERGVEPVSGAAPGTLAVPAEQNLGVIFEFTERS